LSLLLAAGFVHAGWNYLAKQAGGGPVFVWLFAGVSSLVYAPLAVMVFHGAELSVGLPEIGVIVTTIVVHLIYFLLLQQGYRVGDLSLVYPLARGTGPALSMVLAIALFQERPTISERSWAPVGCPKATPAAASPPPSPSFAGWWRWPSDNY